MKCINCYKEIKDTLKFCKYCGTKQPVDRAAYEREHPELADAIPEDEVLAQIKEAEEKARRERETAERAAAEKAKAEREAAERAAAEKAKAEREAAERAAA
ncbi:MAG: hypothetical protein IJ925_01195 [Muribaculaceae bacterium]|nr:hypothetical protein [Muribaculaceae bacterium]